jgi:hypothetical protein
MIFDASLFPLALWLVRMVSDDHLSLTGPCVSCDHQHPPDLSANLSISAGVSGLLHTILFVLEKIHVYAVDFENRNQNQ